MNYLKILIIAFILVSCSDFSTNNFLEKSPESELTDANFFQTEEDAKSAVNGLYATLKAGYDINYISEMIFFSDYSDSRGSRLASGEFRFDQFTITRKSSIWTDFYQLIARANIAIEGIEDAVENESLKNKLKGEALFMRAYGHFVIVRLFGPAPIRTEAINSISQIPAPRMDENAVFDQIINDFENAIELLPDENGLGRVNIAAVKTALSAAYLWRGNYDMAMDYSQQVINSGRYKLIKSLAELYDSEDPAVDEMIFFLRNSRELNQETFLLRFAHALDWPEFGPNWFTFLGNKNSFITEWDENDLRMEWNLYDSETAVVAPSGDTVYVDTGGEILFRKYRDANAITPNILSYNLPIYRYAETLLNYVEADIRLDGNLSEQGREYWNMVRRRGYGVDIDSPAPNIDIQSNLDSNELLEKLLLERGKEFIMEGKRWYDMKRFDKVEELVSKVGHEFEPRILLWPLPQEEIQNNPEIGVNDQNPGF